MYFLNMRVYNLSVSTYVNTKQHCLQFLDFKDSC